jgi:hypothetical protein
VLALMAYHWLTPMLYVHTKTRKLAPLRIHNTQLGVQLKHTGCGSPRSASASTHQAVVVEVAAACACAAAADVEDARVCLVDGLQLGLKLLGLQQQQQHDEGLKAAAAAAGKKEQLQ